MTAQLAVSLVLIGVAIAVMVWILASVRWLDEQPKDSLMIDERVRQIMGDAGYDFKDWQVRIFNHGLRGMKDADQ